MNAVDESVQDPFPPGCMTTSWAGTPTGPSIGNSVTGSWLPCPWLGRPPRPIVSSLSAWYVTSCAAESASSSTSARVYPPSATCTQSRRVRARQRQSRLRRQRTRCRRPLANPARRTRRSPPTRRHQCRPPRPQRLWRQVTDTGLIDFSEPVAVFMIAVLHVRQADEQGSDIGDQIVCPLPGAPPAVLTWSSPTPPTKACLQRSPTHSPN